MLKEKFIWGSTNTETPRQLFFLFFFRVCMSVCLSACQSISAEKFFKGHLTENSVDFWTKFSVHVAISLEVGTSPRKYSRSPKFGEGVIFFSLSVVIYPTCINIGRLERT